jgi:hypothetical protein
MILAFITLVVLILVIYFAFKWMNTETNTKMLVDYMDGSPAKEVTLTNINHGSSFDYTFSIWIYIKTWSTNKDKNLLARYKTGEGSDKDIPVPLVYLSQFRNTLNINLGIQQETSDSDVPVETVSISDIPLQRWCHVLFTIRDNSIDVYLDGGLVKTKVFSNITVKAPAESKVTVGSTNGGDFKISKLYYLARYVEPSEVTKIYSEGPNKNGGAGGLINSYRMKISLMNRGKEMNSITL